MKSRVSWGEWNRLRRILFSNRVDIRFKFTEEPIVLVMRLKDQPYASNTTGIRDITNWDGVPLFVQDLIESQGSTEGFGGYAILNYDATKILKGISCCYNAWLL